MDNYDELIYPYSYFIPGRGGFPARKIIFGVETAYSGPDPSGSGVLETAPAKVKLFQNLTSRAQIYPAASPAAPTNVIASKVEYRAGKDITLLPESGSQPGFEVKYGSDFTAYIKRYVCSSEDYGFGMRRAAPIVSNDYETDDMNMDVPIHNVKHPKSDSDLYPDDSDDEEDDDGVKRKRSDDGSDEEELSNSNKQNEKQFIVKPNPNDGLFMVYLSQTEVDETYTLTIFNAKGEKVTSYEHLQTNVDQVMDLTNYPKGLYLVNITSNKGYTANKKVSVN